MQTFAQNIKDHRWEDRVIIFKNAPENALEMFKKQAEIFKTDPDGMRERKLVVYAVSGNFYGFLDFEEDFYWAPFDQLSPDFKGFLDPTKEFEVILIGLDGGVKLRQNEVLSKEKLFQLIDAMPMRASEIRNKKGD